ncbi:cupin domain-containing protein [Aeoliella sp.]|uniref:cupin domain-containing protein n=1 Tax=Aeoliella sp. TaxID=2795800 RepID=UPI003CCB966E
MSATLFDSTQNSVGDLLSLVSVESEATVTKALLDSAAVRLVLFAMDEGQKLTDHSASKTAFVQVLDGEIEFTLEGQAHRLGPGGWVAMQPGAIHAVEATTPARFLLTLVKEPSA